MPEPVETPTAAATEAATAAATEAAAESAATDAAAATAETAATPNAAATAAVEPTAAETAAAEQATADASQLAIDTAVADAKSAHAKDIAKLLGLPGFEDEVDPAKLAETLAAERDTATAERDADRNALREYQLRDHVRTGSDKKADFAGLYDSSSFLADIKGIDPSDPKAAGLVETAIAAAITRRPSLAFTDPAATDSSSVEHSGDGKPPVAADSVDAFRAQAKAERGDSRF